MAARAIVLVSVAVGILVCDAVGVCVDVSCAVEVTELVGEEVGVYGSGLEVG